jgi:uncharacterized protein YggE
MGIRIFVLPIVVVASFFIFLFTFTAIFGSIPFSITSTTTTKSDTFNVTGEGKVNVIPDVAFITAGVSSSGSSVKLAQDQINTVINKVSAALKDLGIDSKDIQTANYSIYPEYDYREGAQKIKGYSASTNLSIKVRDIDKTSQVIDKAAANGANQIGGISFDIDDKKKLEQEAREKAVAKAKEKAESAAKAVGFKLGRIVNYSEGPSGFLPLVNRAFGVTEVTSDKTTQIETGSVDITINVTLSYEIL